MNERREAETAAATANRSGYRRRRVGIRDTTREFDFGFPLRHHHEKRTFRIGTLPISPGAIAGDEGVANELLRIDLPTARGVPSAMLSGRARSPISSGWSP